MHMVTGNECNLDVLTCSFKFVVGFHRLENRIHIGIFRIGEAKGHCSIETFFATDYRTDYPCLVADIIVAVHGEDQCSPLCHFSIEIDHESIK